MTDAALPTDSAETRAEVRARVRAELGMGGDDPAPDARRRDLSVQSAVVGLNAVRGLPPAIIALLGLPFVAGLGEGPELVTSMAGGLAVGTGIGALLAPSLARTLGDDGAQFGRLAVIGAGLLGLGIAITGFLTPVGGMTVAGLGSGTVAVGTAAAMARGRRIQDRVRGVAGREAARHLGTLAAALIVAAITYGTDVPITGVILGLLVLVLMGMAAGADLASTALPDADLQRVRSVVGDETATTDESTPEPFRRVWSIPTVKHLAVTHVAMGVAFVALHVYLVQFLTQQAELGLWGRGAVYAAVALATAAAVWLRGGNDEDAFRRDPSRLALPAASALQAAAAALVLAAVIPRYGRVLPLLVGFALVGVAKAECDALVVAAVRPRLRAHASAVLVGFGMLLGGGLAAPLLSTVARRADAIGAIVATAIVLAIAGLSLRRAAQSVGDDVDAAVDDEVEAAQVAVLAASGVDLPLLACRGINFSYGPVQVLFDVDFDVEDGQMVGLLGTNGAGKSTLLRVVSGLGTPSSGTVRHHGEDITYLDPAARVLRGITQVPGGKAVFGPLSVIDNLRVHGHSLGRDRRSVDEGIERALATFPRLHERRNSPSRVLSGGERQMLALTKALILRPRLLLIDELSLGLAPVIVAQLMDMVRQINDEGTAIVLVEQSVNVALSLVDHAYYMEKGEIRFDGDAQGLLDRPDLLRSVYLQGAAEGLA